MSHKRNKRNKAKQTEPPSLADIVRQETDNGRTIVRFYLDVASGKLDDEGFEVCHRLEAAEQVHAIAPGLVSEYIAQLTGVECNHVLRRRRTRDTTVVPAEASRRSREDGNPSPDADCANSSRVRHESLEYLASALAAPSLADDPRVAGIVRESTDHGKTVVSFLMHVMHGVVRGFRPRQRVQAASELLGHIARDELARSGSLTVEPALSAVEGSFPVASSSFPRRREPIPGPGEPAQSLPKGQVSSDAVSEKFPGPAEADLPVIPAKACPVPRYGAGIQTQSEHTSQPIDPGSGAALPTKNAKLETKNPPDYRGCYEIDRKIAEAQRDPAHPIHKFVQAYDEVAAAFQAEDKQNDEDEEVRYWISGEVPDAYRKYIWGYAPANPRSVLRRLRPKRRPSSTPKAESVWMKRPTDKMREAGIPKPKRTLMWI